MSNAPNSAADDSIRDEMIGRHPDLLDASRSRLLLVDLQERLVPAMSEPERLLKRCRRLAETASLLSVPITVTEQYPAGLGHTVESLQPFAAAPLEKLDFSAAPVLPFCQMPPWSGGESDGSEHNLSGERDQVIIAGIEAHVCVMQTCMDLMTWGFRVYLPVDATDSRHTQDREIALRRLSDCGVFVMTTESVLFEWCGSAAHPQFKGVRKVLFETE